MTRVCIDCAAFPTHAGRCKAHDAAYRVKNAARLRRRAVIARGQDAASTLRRSVQRAGKATCTACGIEYLASAVDIDHILPLSQGGEDVADNVQILCRAVCHAAKTRRDLGYTKAPF